MTPERSPRRSDDNCSAKRRLNLDDPQVGGPEDGTSQPNLERQEGLPEAHALTTPEPLQKQFAVLEDKVEGMLQRMTQVLRQYERQESDEVPLVRDPRKGKGPAQSETEESTNSAGSKLRIGGNTRRRTQIFDSQKMKKQHKYSAPNGGRSDHDDRNSEPVSLDKGKPADQPESSEKRHNQKEKGFDLEELLDQADSPFTEEIMREKVPPKFKLPTVKQRQDFY
ncbi:uncharacterized protein LOC111014646 [Momordica charantia]|uniref:Uncharacterized protein LOC111014646 n=1 Tax=Momordica charantia TaxID=3673 RepID=A0A6J1CUA7_MOMCH|nr:uncharacterized protein LOC111014646 [Momordica charantia]